jgi:outer membrane murein-binding lipoprotein Lpp
MRIVRDALVILVLLVGAQAQDSASEVRALAARVQRLEQRLAQLEAQRVPFGGGMFRIVTENKNREAVEKLLKERFSGFTMYEVRGHFKGAERWYDESSLVIEVVGAGRANVESAACAIRELNGQEAVLIEEVPVRSLLMNAPGAQNGTPAPRQRRTGKPTVPRTRPCVRRSPVR